MNYITEYDRDHDRIGTELYQGKAFFWNYKYRWHMRGDSESEGISIEDARIKIHKQFLDEGLDLVGETSRHDQIINEVFGDCNYVQEGEIR